jgi:hypothetical protein
MIDNAKFKELLSLHLDHRLSAEEAALLERVLAADPARRRTFQSYAAMQRGCAELFRRSAADAPAPDALVRALRQAESRMGRRPAPFVGWRTWGVPVGLAAAVALIVARVSQPALVVNTDSAPEPTARLARETAAPVPVLVAEAVPQRAQVRVPEHLTLAALGIATERGATGSLSRWSDAVEVVSEESAPDLISTWEAEVSASTLTEWGRAAAPREFSGRPINAWAGQSGYQVQGASYTFER